MKIDWFTVAAQALNFIVLLWLMKRFLYKPILHAIDEREKHIAEQLGNAKTERETAQKQKETFTLKKEELENQSASFLKIAEDGASTEKIRLMNEAREAADSFRINQINAFTEEEKSSHSVFIQKAQKEIIVIAGKVLADLSGTSLEERIVEVFTQRLINLSSEEKKALSSVQKTQSDAVTIRTALGISPRLRVSIEAAVKEAIGTETRINYVTEPGLISGIELNVNGQKAAWNIADYLSSIEENVNTFLTRQNNDKQTKGVVEKQ